MNTAKIMEDGDLRLPNDVSNKLNFKPGDSLDVELTDDGTLRLYPKTVAVEDVCGMLRPASEQHVTVEGMDEGIGEAFQRGQQ